MLDLPAKHHTLYAIGTSRIARFCIDEYAECTFKRAEFLIDSVSDHHATYTALVDQWYELNPGVVGKVLQSMHLSR
jgi:hypothetical protein